MKSGYPKIIKTLLLKGTLIEDDMREYRNEKFTLDISPVMITFKDTSSTLIPNNYLYSKNYLKIYAKQFTSKSKRGFEYTYGERLFAYYGEIDQISSNVISRLNENITSRRATATTMIPHIDVHKGDIPCLQLVDFKYNNDKLNLIVYFRSQDIMALPANVYGLHALLQYVTEQLDCCTGEITLVDGSLHAYSRDWDYLIDRVYGKKTSKSILKKLERKNEQLKYINNDIA